MCRIYFLIIFCLVAFETKASIVKGVFKLPQNSLKNISLKGQWRFYKNKFIDPQTLIKKTSPPKGSFVQIPGVVIPRFGYGTLLLKIEGLVNEMTIQGNIISSAQETFAVTSKGVKELFKIGKVGKSPKEEIPQLGNVTSILAPSSSTWIVIHISNFHYRNGHVQNPFLGSKENIKRDLHQKSFFNSFVMGILFIMGLYYLAIFAQRKSDMTSLFFSLFCMNMLIWLLSGNSSGYYLNSFLVQKDAIAFNISLSLEFISLVFFSTLITGYLGHLFRDDFFLKLKNINFIIALLFLPFCLFGSPSFFTQKAVLFFVLLITLLNCLIILTRLIIFSYQSYPASKIIFLGCTVFFIGFLDELYINFFLHTENSFLPTTLSFFVFIQSYVLSIKFNQAYETSAQLSISLKESLFEERKLRKTVTDSFNEISMLSYDLKNLNKDMDKLMKERTQEIASLLAVSQQAFFAFNQTGIILDPISSYANHLFQKDILNEKLSHILYPNLKPGSGKFEELRKNLIKVFGQDETFFNSFKSSLPSQLELSTKESEKKILKLHYSPIFADDKKVVKVLCLAEDKTMEIERFKRAVEESLSYRFLKDILHTEEKDRLSLILPLKNSIKICFYLLDELSSPSIETSNPEAIISNVKSDAWHIISHLPTDILRNECSSRVEEIEKHLVLIKTHSEKLGHIPLSSILGVSDSISSILASLLKYTDELNTFGIKIKLDTEISDIIKNTQSVLDAQFSNLLEYTLIIHSEDLQTIQEPEYEKAADNVRTNNRKNFEANKAIIYQKIKLLSLLHFVTGKMKMHYLYEHFIDSIKSLPKSDVITSHDLRNNLFKPYMDLKKRPK